MDDELLALVVHDLRNPLAALLSNLEFVALKVRDDPTAREAAADCMLSIETLVRLVDNLGAIGPLEAGGGGGAEVSVAEAVASVGARMRRHAEASRVGLVTSCEPDVGRVAVGARLLELALDNLVATSVAYAPPGSDVRLEARRADGDVVAITVVDDGPPVAEEARPLVVRKDAQAAVKAARGGRYGRGLGLYLAALVARAAGGTASAGEARGASTFELRLPARPLTAP